MKIVTILFTIYMLFALCNNSPDFAGGGSSTGNANTIAGIIKEANGHVAVNSDVLLYRIKNVNAITLSDTEAVAKTVTDSTGTYIFRDVDSGGYKIYCNSSSSATSTIAGYVTVNERDSSFVGIATLRTKTGLSGNVENITGTPAVAIVYGTPLFAEIDSTTGWFFIDGLPSVDTVSVIFKTMKPVNGQYCQAFATYTLSADTTMVTTVKLVCN